MQAGKKALELQFFLSLLDCIETAGSYRLFLSGTSVFHPRTLLLSGCPLLRGLSTGIRRLPNYDAENV